jgi:hypothetical protein
MSPGPRELLAKIPYWARCWLCKFAGEYCDVAVRKDPENEPMPILPVPKPPSHQISLP